MYFDFCRYKRFQSEIKAVSVHVDVKAAVGSLQSYLRSITLAEKSWVTRTSDGSVRPCLAKHSCPWWDSMPAHGFLKLSSPVLFLSKAMTLKSGDSWRACVEPGGPSPMTAISNTGSFNYDSLSFLCFTAFLLFFSTSAVNEADAVLADLTAVTPRVFSRWSGYRSWGYVS